MSEDRLATAPNTWRCFRFQRQLDGASLESPNHMVANEFAHDYAHQIPEFVRRRLVAALAPFPLFVSALCWWNYSESQLTTYSYLNG
jgi:hypothetical protein